MSIIKVVISKDYGGCGIDDIIAYIIGMDYDNWNYDTLKSFPRNDKRLVDIVEKEKKKGRYPHIKIVDIPDDVEFVIMDYDGIEWVAEKHRTWH